MLDIDTIDSELRLVAALRGAARERGGPLPSIDVGMRCWMNACGSSPATSAAPTPPAKESFLSDLHGRYR